MLARGDGFDGRLPSRKRRTEEFEMDQKFDAKQQHDQTQDLQARRRVVMGEKLEVCLEF